ncbi:MAG: hypothetical protein V7K92_08405 [Nostoc sp.]|uniref:Panacea domain-containing protein n=1 Tax=Nostoc sp. TaxID=1180 RepID=UPI002FF31601
MIPALYQKYKLFGWQPILEDANPDLPQEVQEFLNEVAQEYFACDAYELEQMTHAETPWNLARGNLLPDEPSNEVIQKQWMKEYYGSRAKKKIKKTEVAKDGTSGIKPTKLKPLQGISFSFKYYQDSNSKFSCREKEVIYWLTLLDRLKALSSLTAQELLVNRSSTLRCHPIK